RSRLKAGENPAGLAPGEAGACFLVESEESARRRNAKAAAMIVGAAVGEERAHFLSDEVSTGVGLGGVIAALVPESSPFAGDVIADLNGEEWRARELACARLRAPNRIDNARFLYPAASLGETGAASGAAAVCLATRAFVRSYDRAGQALVLMSSEHGHLGG